jgi:NSS family neurotransmitter:Na+ symporter
VSLLREQFTSNLAFIVASIGSAVGLGNIWRFSYVAGENGGAVFLFVYFVLVALIGLPLVIAELTVGRRSAGDAVSAFESEAQGSRWRHVGWIGAVGAFLILSYYAVIAGWALKYLVGALTGALWQQAGNSYGAYFARFIANTGEPIAWQAAMMLAGMLIVLGGVRRGIERANVIIMPLLAVIIVVLAGFALTFPGAGKGVRFLLAPDWSALARPGVYIAALGQAFFSVGVGMAVFVTYGSYMRRDQHIPRSAVAIVAGDTVFALVAGLAIFPTVFAFQGDPAAGPELAFITLPQVFLQMPAGAVAGAIFFFLLVAAALTSIVSLLEVPIAIAIHRLGMRRWTATMAAGSAILVLGIPSALSYGVLKTTKIAGLPVLDAVDHAVSNLVLPLGGLLIALFVGWKLDDRNILQDANLAGTRLGHAWRWLLKYLVPVMIVVIIVHSLSR